MQIYNTREDFLRSLPKNGVIAEIGVFYGEHAMQMYKICTPTQLVLIDPWLTAPTSKINGRWAKMPQSELDSYYHRVCSDFKNLQGVSILKLPSVEAAASFEDNYFDWVYIDGNHIYEAVAQDLEAWLPKIKKGGFLCGHDYSDTESTRKKGDGVFAAVNDFCKKYNLSVGSIGGDINARCFSIEV